MIIQPTSLHGAFTIDVCKHEDNRGFFARTFCVETFKNHHLETVFMQQNMSVSNKKHTLRGMHYQHRKRRRLKRTLLTLSNRHDNVFKNDTGNYEDAFKAKRSMNLMTRPMKFTIQFSLPTTIIFSP